jgi:hypothetical protein
MKRARLAALGLGAGLVLLGAVAGVGAGRHLAFREVQGWAALPSPQARRQLLVWAFARRLDLDEGQRQAFERILSPAVEAERRRWIEPRIEAARARVRAELRQVMRPDQLAAFDALAAEREALYRATAPGEPPAGETP